LTAGLDRVQPARVPSSGIVEIGSEKQLFLDDELVAERSRISNFVRRPEKHPQNPILVADRPWETATDDGIELDTQATLYDEEAGLFKMWYLPAPWPGGGRPWCYAVSQNGSDWQKPDLGLMEYRGSTRNSIVRVLDTQRDLTYTNVVRTPHDPDPQRLYKTMGELENGPVANRFGGAAVAFSPDGLNWTDWPGNPVIPHGPNLADAPTIFGWDPWKRKYAAYPRPGHPLAMEVVQPGPVRDGRRGQPVPPPAVGAVRPGAEAGPDQFQDAGGGEGAGGGRGPQDDGRAPGRTNGRA
jgi:hypothetical protein